MVQIILLLVYLALSYWVALYGRDTRAGFIGTLLLSLLVTPVVGAIFLYAFSPADEEMELSEDQSEHAQSES